MHLTDLSIKALKAPANGAKIYTDDMVSGFGVRITANDVRSFVLTHGIRRQRQTIGRVGVISLREARSAAKHILAEQTLGKTETRSVSWKTALEEYLDEVAAKRRASTYAEYKRSLSRHFRFGETKVSDLTPHDLQRKLDKLADTPSEQQHAFTYMRAFVKWCFQRTYIDKNPMERMKAPHRYNPRERVLTDDELKRVWTAAAGMGTFGVIVKLLCLTGQRVGEISKLTPEMIGENTITFPAWLTKNNREHTIPIGALCSSLLAAQLHCSLSQASTPVFLARSATTAVFSGWSKSKAKLDGLSGVKDWRLHDLRRTFASGLAAEGVLLPVVEKLLNHLSGSFGGIVGVYQRHTFLPEMRQAVDKWEAHILAITSPTVVTFRRLSAAHDR